MKNIARMLESFENDTNKIKNIPKQHKQNTRKPIKPRQAFKLASRQKSRNSEY